MFYTGNGKGKTTAAFGLALRAAGAGKNVYIAQFVKGKTYSEIKALRKYLPQITVEQFGRGCFIINEPTKEDIDAAQKGLQIVKNNLQNGLYNLVILDEIFIAVYFKLISIDELRELINQKPEPTEMILTGRHAPQEIMDEADLVTEMKEIKHYYTNGVEAREGIEY
ncbi:MAG: cob(I)yrinic acid a,c-diamide adenosyltransferase [Bacteroidales bacterium]